MNITREGEELSKSSLDKLSQELRMINQTLEKLENRKVELLHKIHKEKTRK